MNNKLSYTINEATEAVGLGRTTIYKLIAQGRLTAIKIGRRTLISAASLDELISRSCSEG